MKKTVLIIGSMASAMLLACVAVLLTAEPGVGKKKRTVTLVGAGDIARCDSSADRATAKLLRRISGTVFTLGDNAYPDGTRSQFRDCYGPTWGKYKKRTKPAVGNHEYHIRGARPYFDYFGSAGGEARQRLLLLRPRQPGTSSSSTATARRWAAAPVLARRAG